MSKGVELIAAERRRQIEEEGYTDDKNANPMEELALAAVCYAMPTERRLYQGLRRTPLHWPWGPNSWKPDPADRVRELVKAGALIAAEIDRLLGDSGEEDTEKAVVEAMRNHPGGLGGHLTKEQKDRILYGIPEKAENTKPFDEKKFLAAATENMEQELSWLINAGRAEDAGC